MKPTLHKVQTRTGRRIHCYYATGHGIEAEGKTPREARLAWDLAAMGALGRLERGTFIGQFRGHTFVVFPTLYGWSYWLDTFTHGYTGHGAGQTQEDAQDHALHHLAQNLWDVSCDDDAAFCASIPVESVRDKIASWVRWQRGYEAGRLLGLTDEACRERANAACYRGAA
jgi:hypothetical protein